MINKILIKSSFYYILFNLIYYMASGIMFFCDYVKCLWSYKIQSINPDVIEEYKKSLPCVLKNTFFNTIIPAILLGWYDVIYKNDFTLVKCVCDIILMAILTEIFFYSTHMMFHTSWLYVRFHKKHHQFTSPIGISAVYTTTIDFIFGNFVPVYLPVLICFPHPITLKLWMIITTFDTVIFAHSGFIIADFHDKHHLYFNKNFGTGFFMDKLFETKYGD